MMFGLPTGAVPAIATYMCRSGDWPPFSCSTTSANAGVVMSEVVAPWIVSACVAAVLPAANENVVGLTVTLSSAGLMTEAVQFDAVASVLRTVRVKSHPLSHARLRALGMLSVFG